ncbi:MAG: 50S ribosomal protein L3 [Candidatus Dojkabacteria bacterium]|nr:50S ribosomal protein L3 [Candidatus Dojkabacteria bacterium]
MKIFLGKKIGMTQIYDSSGICIPVTLINVSDNYISRIFSNNGLIHIEIGKDRKKNPNKAEIGMYSELGFVPRFRNIVTLKEHEFDSFNNITSLSKISIGAFNIEDIFTPNMCVDVVGITKGKGFAGVVKRYNMKGGPRTHGQSDRERAVGAIGCRTIPGRVFKGKRLPGHMGVVKKTIKNLKIVEYNKEDQVIFVTGAVPGARNSYLVIKSK